VGTQSNLYIEKEDGSYIGVYCHYDGYPEHMLKQINYCSYDELHNFILVGGTRGGYRLFAPATEETEFLESAQPHYIYDPEDDGDLGIDFIYVKCLDGKVKWRACMSDKWIVG
tara:strand:- start:404 stop:742 length:339 start_codon:yes stop_codon:yes gene_type:complete